MRRDPCAACGLPVFLAEKLVVDRTPYHRTCFRCARCNNQLTPGNYYETEEGQYCCETCPDEEPTSTSMHQKYNEAIISSVTGKTTNAEDVEGASYQRSLSDEEKTGITVLKSSRSPGKGFEDPSVPDLIAQTSQMRLNFMASHLLSSEGTSTVDGPLMDDDTRTEDVRKDQRTGSLSRADSAFPDGDEDEDEQDQLSYSTCSSTESEEKAPVKGAGGDRLSEAEDDVHNVLDDSTAISHHDVVKDNLVSLVSREDDTKELLGQADERGDTGRCLSLVQQRLRMFEAQDHVERKDKEPSTNAQVVLQPKSLPTKRSAIDGSDQRLSLRTKTSETRADSEELSKTESVNRIEEDSSRVSGTSLSDLTISEKSLDATVEGSTSHFVNETKNATPGDDSALERSKDGASVTTAKGVDLSVGKEYPEDLNPFKSDDDEDEVVPDQTAKEGSATRKKAPSTNPFDSDDDEEEKEVTPPKPAARSNLNNSRGKQAVEVPTKRRLVAPQINLNPFWSDDDEHDSDLDSMERTTPGNMPVPKPRTINRNMVHASNSSIASLDSAGGSSRKKKPAPQPPTAKDFSVNLSGLHELSPRTTPRARKAKPAPPPPISTSTPHRMNPVSPFNFDGTLTTETQVDTSIGHDVNVWEEQKTNKDEANRNRQGLTNVPCGENLNYKSYPDKSVQGKWKRKKGPAPPRPIPHRRKIKVLSLKDVKLELDEIEMQQQGLEKQGVRLEQLIRDKCESGSRIDDTSLGMDVEELVLELFALVNEKNELFRRQAELMLLRRQQRLEEEHAEVEYQIRCLMSQPEATKTDCDKQREEALIQRLVEIVERRNEIVECLEMDRRREVEEDRSIHKHMGLFAARNKNDVTSNNDSNSSKTKKGKAKEKAKEKKTKKTPKKDADKDVDETEVKLKRHKRKWF